MFLIFLDVPYFWIACCSKVLRSLVIASYILTTSFFTTLLRLLKSVGVLSNLSISNLSIPNFKLT